MSQTRLTEAFVCNVLFWLFFVLVLSETVLVLVIDPQSIFDLLFGNTIEAHCHPREHQETV